MPHASLKLNEPVGDKVKTTTRYMCACRCGAEALSPIADGGEGWVRGQRVGTPHVVEDRDVSPSPQPSPPTSSGEREQSDGAGGTDWRIVHADAIGISPLIVGEYTLPDGRRTVPAFPLLAERFLADEYAPEAVAPQCGVDAATIRRIATELADVAFEQAIRIPQHWTDAHGREHAETIGRPVSMHAMRGISAHGNGFHTCRMLHVLQMLLGAIDTPGSFRYQPPYPKAAPPANRPGKSRRANGALDAAPLGFVHAPDDLLDLGARLRLPGMVDEDGDAKYPSGYAQYIVEHERAPGVGLLAGWRRRDGSRNGVGEPNPNQLDVYKANNCYWHAPVPAAGRYYKMANRDYLNWAKSLGFVGSTDAIVLELYSERLQTFRLAAQGHGAQQPRARDRERVARYFDPLPMCYASLDDGAAVLPSPRARGAGGEGREIHRRLGKPRPSPRPLSHGEGDSSDASPEFPLSAITQRPMFMYQAWGPQNAWLRQIATHNYLYLHPETAAAHGVADGDWDWVESAHARIRVPARLHAGTAPGTVWTWNAIGKLKGAWKLAPDAREYTKGFLLNQVIDDLLPPRGDGHRYANADPVTGQAAWFDLEVRICRDAGNAETAA